MGVERRNGREGKKGKQMTWELGEEKGEIGEMNAWGGCDGIFYAVYIVWTCSEGSRIWSTLSAESQEVLRPHLTSR